MSANEESLPWEKLQRYLGQFEDTVNSQDVEQSRILLVESVSGFSPQCDVADLVQEKNRQSSDEAAGDNIIRYPG